MRGAVANGKFRPFSEVLGWRQYSAINWPDNEFLWSRWDYLLTTEPKKFADFMLQVKGRVDPATWVVDQSDIVAACREALRTVPDAELSRQVDLSQVQEFLVPRAVHPCMGEVFRDLFGGESCHVMMGAKGGAETADKVCGCLKPAVARFSDAEAAELGVSFVQYQSMAELARMAGKPAPPRSPLL